MLSCVHFPSEESCTKEIIILGGALNTRAATLTMKLPLFDTYIHIPGTKISIVLIGKDLVLEGSTTKTEDKEVPGRYTNLYLYTCTVFKSYIMLKGCWWTSTPEIAGLMIRVYEPLVTL